MDLAVDAPYLHAENLFNGVRVGERGCIPAGLSAACCNAKRNAQRPETTPLPLSALIPAHLTECLAFRRYTRGSLIPYYLWIHVVFALFMYGNGSVFPSDVSGDTSIEDAAADTSDTINIIDMVKVKVNPNVL